MQISTKRDSVIFALETFLGEIFVDKEAYSSANSISAMVANKIVTLKT